MLHFTIIVRLLCVKISIQNTLVLTRCETQFTYGTIIEKVSYFHLNLQWHRSALLVLLLDQRGHLLGPRDAVCHAVCHPTPVHYKMTVSSASFCLQMYYDSFIRILLSADVVTVSSASFCLQMYYDSFIRVLLAAHVVTVSSASFCLQMYYDSFIRVLLAADVVTVSSGSFCLQM